jgi:hypothetical protein
MILILSVHPSRLSDLLTPDRVRLDPPILANTYHDGFGNLCHSSAARNGAGRLLKSRRLKGSVSEARRHWPQPSPSSAVAPVCAGDITADAGLARC